MPWDTPSPDGAAYIKPGVAVMKFENRAQFDMHWDLGGGMRDILVDRLVEVRQQ